MDGDFKALQKYKVQTITVRIYCFKAELKNWKRHNSYLKNTPYQTLRIRKQQLVYQIGLQNNQKKKSIMCSCIDTSLETHTKHTILSACHRTQWASTSPATFCHSMVLTITVTTCHRTNTSATNPSLLSPLHLFSGDGQEESCLCIIKQSSSWVVC